jgi:hypothetical protein
MVTGVSPRSCSNAFGHGSSWTCISLVLILWPSFVFALSKG